MLLELLQLLMDSGPSVVSHPELSQSLIRYEIIPEAMAAVTWWFCHAVLSCPLSPSYYVNGRDTSLEDFLDPDVLDTLALKTNEVLEVTVSGCSSWVAEGLMTKMFHCLFLVWLREYSRSLRGNRCGSERRARPTEAARGDCRTPSSLDSCESRTI